MDSRTLRDALTAFAEHRDLLVTFVDGASSLTVREMSGRKVADLFDLKDGFHTLAEATDYPESIDVPGGRVTMEVTLSSLSNGRLSMKEADV